MTGEAMPTSIYVKPGPWREFKELLMEKEKKKVSPRLQEIIDAEIARLKGVQAKAAEPSYEDLKARHMKLVRELDPIEKMLRKQGDVYNRLMQQVRDLGLDCKDLHNLDQVAVKLMKKWTGLAEHAHLFITLMEIAQEKKMIEQKLTEIRAKNACS